MMNASGHQNRSQTQAAGFQRGLQQGHPFIFLVLGELHNQDGVFTGPILPGR